MRLWLRWSLRDLRRRWLQVAAVAMIIGIGTGLYSGLSSASEWRKVSYDASFERLHMYDLHGALSPGAYVDAQQLVVALQTIPHARELRAVQARLIAPAQVDASRGGRTVLVPGRLVGVDVAATPMVNGIAAKRGRTLMAADADRNIGVLDEHFARHYHLPARTRVTVSGGARLDIVGQGVSPEYFVVAGNHGVMLGEANFAVVFTSIATVQRLTDHPGSANDFVITLRAGANRAQLQQEIGKVLAERFSNVGATFNRPRGDLAYRILYDDIKGDQRFYNIFAVLVLGGATLAAFNLTGRIVEAQRREIGVGMALGVTPAKLAIRPLLLGVEVGVLGVLFGLGVGIAVDVGMGGVLQTLQPLPVWRFPFQPWVFARGAGLGLALSVLAAAYPVWRSVRVTPIEAIRTGFLSAKSTGLAPLLARFPVPARSITLMPFRNVVRAPRRTIMTALGVAAAIVVLIGVIGMVDSFVATIDRAESELAKTSPDRLLVEFERFELTSSPVVDSVRNSRYVSAAEPTLQLPSTVQHGRVKFPVYVELVDFRSRLWHPTVNDRTKVRGPGIVLSDTAADNLGVVPGDHINLVHPRREGLTYRFVTTELPVIGVNPLPLRSSAFMDLQDAALMNLTGITNTMVVTPADHVSATAVQRGLFGEPGIASVQPVAAYTQTIRQTLKSALGILKIVELAVLLLALLIAFNSASINADERAREEATMFAFGVRLRTVLRVGTTESFVIGLLGTAVGLLAGWGLLAWLVSSLLPQTFPDMGLVTSISATTLWTAVALGVVAVTLAPLLTARKLARMDIPSTLRVVE